jgi:DNA polymerase-4
MNNFYASVECVLHPELRDKPLAVCGRAEERHGIVLAKNYLAKACGVKTGEAIWQAKQKCPNLLIVDPHYREYIKYSRRAREIYSRYTDQVEPYGMDEVWLDVTGSRRLYGTGEEIANKIREQIKSELGLTVSIGVSFNKIFAKLGSDLKKPDAVTCISRERYREQIWGLPATDMLGVGRAAGKVLRTFGIHTIGELANAPDDFLRIKFGVNGLRMKRYANGEDYSKVMEQDYSFPIKSVGNGTTFLQDLYNEDEVWPMILALSDRVAQRLREAGKRACGVSLTVKCPDLSWKEWQTRLDGPSHNAYEIAERVFALFKKNYPWVKPIRALYVRAISLRDTDAPMQLTILTDGDKLWRKDIIDKTIDNIRAKYGGRAILSAATMVMPKMPHSYDDIELILPTGMLTV